MKSPRTTLLTLVLLSAVGLASCGDETSLDADVESSSPEQGTLDAAAAREETLAARRTPVPLDGLFTAAEAEFGVPAALLKAYSYAQTRWEMVVGEEEFEGRGAAYGLMALRGPQIARGAELAHVSEEAVRTDPRANIRAAAALLASHAEELGVDRERLGAWASALAVLADLGSEAATSAFIHEDVYGALGRGVTARTPAGEAAVTLEAAPVVPEYPELVEIRAAGPDYPSSIWRPSPNYNSRPTGSIGDPAMIVIHTCEGAYAGCWGWMTNPASSVSAHYAVKEDGSEISQLVREAHRAWHVAASYNCSLNSNVECWRNGNSVNHFSVGIEHGGYASQASFPAGQIDASARLSCDISRDQAIPRDRYHIVAHGKLQPYNRTDPGPHWPWTDYLNKINAYCATGLVIDSNNAYNDPTRGYIEVSANWTSSTSVAGYYGSGYWWVSTAPVSDPAVFYFYLPAPATKTIDAWWTAATDRAPAAPFLIMGSTGAQLGKILVNQSVDGGRWNTLGTWSFPAGWNKILLSRWTASGKVVIADAVRVR